MKTWDEFFDSISNKEYWKKLMSFLDEEYSKKTIFPPRNLLFNAFKLTPVNSIKVVVIGQDPYHEKGQAMGLAFSVPNDCNIPPSLNNIFKEIEIETGRNCKKNGDLTYLAKQGVFLINTILSVEESKPLSHKIKEYSLFIQDLLSFLNELDNPIAFMLWGGSAHKYEKFIKNKNRLIIKRTHPSPLGANKGGWFNENQFNICNEFLVDKGQIPIDWNN